jgi:hypothetical protein
MRRSVAGWRRVGRALVTAIVVALPAAVLAASPQERRAEDARSLAGRLGSLDETEREAAVAALAALGPRAIPAVFDSAPGLLGTTEDEFSRWSKAATATLRGMGRPAALTLGRALEDPRDLVQIVAAHALVGLGADAEPATAQLGRALESSTPLVGSSAAEALRAIGAPAVPVLAAALGSGEARVREHAAFALVELGRLDDPAVESRLSAFGPTARALGLMALADAAVLSANTFVGPVPPPPPPPPPPPRDGAPRLEAPPPPAVEPLPDDTTPLLRSAWRLYGRALAQTKGADGGVPHEIGERSLVRVVQLATELGEDEAGAADASRLLALHPEVPEAVATVAEFHARFGRLDAAEKLYRDQLAGRRDKDSCRTLAQFLYRPLWNGKPRREETLATLEACAPAPPEDAQLWVLLATYAWDWAYRDPMLSKEAKTAIVRRGLAAVDRALALTPEAVEAIVYEAMLLKVQATLESDGARRRALLAEAERLRQRATEARQSK